MDDPSGIPGAMPYADCDHCGPARLPSGDRTTARLKAIAHMRKVHGETVHASAGGRVCWTADESLFREWAAKGWA